jgi:hypothetical protein
VLAEVYGYDIGPTYGTPGGSWTVTLQNAVPAQNVVKSILTDTGLINTPPGLAYNNYVQSVTSFQIKGFGLFACRAAHQCGSWSYKASSTGR